MSKEQRMASEILKNFIEDLFHEDLPETAHLKNVIDMDAINYEELAYTFFVDMIEQTCAEYIRSPEVREQFYFIANDEKLIGALSEYVTKTVQWEHPLTILEQIDRDELEAIKRDYGDIE